ncbi:MAG: RNA pseudouridine synthase [Cyclobacteriaceae bacterium]
MKKIDFQSLILEETDDYILVSKPPFLSTLEDRVERFSVQRLAQDYFPEAQIAHRLDKETSGILAIAKNPAAYRSLAIQFEKREVNKIYHAVVAGIHDLKDEEINVPIKKLTIGVVRIDKGEGKPSLTRVSTIRTFRKHTLLECRPVTGRMHQIRIHLSSIGVPIVGDTQYHGSHLYLSEIKSNYNLKKWTEEQPLIKRVALHAFQLEFKDLQGNLMKGEAPYPKDFNVLVKQLDKQSL